MLSNPSELLTPTNFIFHLFLKIISMLFCFGVMKMIISLRTITFFWSGYLSTNQRLILLCINQSEASIVCINQSEASITCCQWAEPRDSPCAPSSLRVHHRVETSAPHLKQSDLERSCRFSCLRSHSWRGAWPWRNLVFRVHARKSLILELETVIILRLL